MSIKINVNPSHEQLSESTNAELSKYTHAYLNSHYQVFGQDGKILEGGKLIAYVIDVETLKIKDFLEFEDYEFLSDTEFADKSSITVFRKPVIDRDDYVICKCGKNTVYTGIFKEYSSNSKSSEYKLTLLQKEQLFDRFVFIKGENAISETGIEDFIAATIKNNWITSGDDMTDRPYMTVTALTHTPVYAKVSSTVTLTDGTFNLKTYLGNALEYYGIRIGIEISGEKLNIYIAHISDKAISINVKDSDISEYSETYAVDALTKLLVQWGHTDPDDTQKITEITEHEYYLLNDRTISTDRINTNRAKGSTRSKYITAETEEEMYQSVQDSFSSNSYSHKISFKLYMESKLYDYLDFYIGRSCTIKTKNGIRTSLVTALSLSNDSRFVTIELGKLKVTLIDKIRSII